MSSIDGAAPQKKKMILLKSSDEVTFEVEESVALESQTIKHMIEGNCADATIPLPNITSEILAMIIEYCKRHVQATVAEDEEDLELFDDEFVKMDPYTLFELILAANYLRITSLLDLTCKTVVDTIRRDTPEGIRKLYNMRREFTPAFK